jgi:glycosyltransferase involved in cell wall biosynthesis
MNTFPGIGFTMSNRKKNLLIIGSLPPPVGGATVLFETILKSEVTTRFKARFLDIKSSDTISKQGAFSLTKIVRLATYVRTLIGILLRDRIDLVYSAIQFNRLAFARDIFLASISKAFRIKLVGCIVGIGLDELYAESGPIWKLVIKYGVSLYDSFIIPSKELPLRFFPPGLISTDKYRVVPFGIFTESDFSLTETDGIPDRIQILYYSHFHRSKGVDEVIKAIPLINREYPNVNYVFAGAWDSMSHKEEIFKIIAGSGLSSKIAFYDIVSGDNRKEILQNSSIYVLPTYFEYEGLPLSILEAMSYGCAIVATDHAAIASAVADGINGAICRPGDPEDVAEKIIYLIENRDLLKNIRLNNMRKFKEFYTAERFGERLALVLGDLSR